jgi:hypothetical protein
MTNRAPEKCSTSLQSELEELLMLQVIADNLIKKQSRRIL